MELSPGILPLDRKFQGWTLDTITATIKQHTDKKWIDEVIDRYLDFGKIDNLMNQGDTL